MFYDWVVVDVEVQKTIEETPGGWNATDQLGVAVACLWEYSNQRMRVYGPQRVEALRERLLKADRISGFNIFNFDFPVIWGIPKPQWMDEGLPSPSAHTSPSSTAELKQKLLPKTDDALRRIWQAMRLDPDKFVAATHGGWNLDRVAMNTLGVSKIGYGGDAPKWYQAGLIQKVVNYCADDVALERDLTDFIDRYGYVLNSINGRMIRLEIPKWEGGK